MKIELHGGDHKQLWISDVGTRATMGLVDDERELTVSVDPKELLAAAQAMIALTESHHQSN